MKLTYETGTGTLIQFIVLSLLNIANGVNSIVTSCRHTNECVGNLLTSIIFYILIVVWFGCIWLLGYTAQERRSKRLAQLLICAEGLVALIAFFNAHHHTDLLSLFTSLVDLALAVWVVTMAFRLMRAGGGRVRAKQVGRARKRRQTPSL